MFESAKFFTFTLVPASYFRDDHDDENEDDEDEDEDGDGSFENW